MARSIRNVLPRPIVRRLRSIAERMERKRYKAAIDAFPVRTVTHRYGTEELDVRIADPQGELWYDHDWSAEDLPELDLLRQGKLNLGATVFDLGSHQGVVACLLARCVGKTGRVIAVDPHPHNVALARENAHRNGCASLQVIEAAVSNQPGTLRFSHRLNTTAREADQPGYFDYEVPSRTIDDLAAEFGRPDVLFVDVEGFEAKALEGAESTLRTCPDVFVEVHVGCGLEEAGSSIEDVLAFFRGTPYELLVATERDRRFRPLEVSSLPRERFFLVARA